MNEPRYLLTGEPYNPLSKHEDSDVPQAERPSYSNRRNAGQDEMPSLVLEYWKLLRRHQWTILFIAFLGALAGLLVALPQTRVYHSQTTLEIQPQTEVMLNNREVDPSMATDYYAAETNLPTQIKIIQSETLNSRVLTKLNLDQHPEVLEQPDRISVWRKALRLPEPKSVSSREQAVAMASGSLSVRILPQTRIVAISTDSTDPRIAAQFVDTLANEYIEQSIEVRWKSTQRTGDWLTRQLEDIKIKLQKSEDQLQSYAYATGLMFTGEKNSVDEEKLRQLQEALSTAQAERFTKQSQFGITVSNPVDSLPQVLDDVSLKNYQEKLTDLRRQRAELRTLFAPGHYKVKAADAQIKELETTLSKERNNISQRIHNDYEAALRNEKLVAEAYAQQAKLVSEQAAKAVQYNILKREVDTNRSLYESLLQKVKEYGIAAAMRMSSMRVVDPARIPTFPYKPNFMRSTTFGLLAGVFLGIVFAVVRERADHSLHSPGDAPLYLNVREFGVIPLARADRKARIYGHRQPLVTLQIDSGSGKTAADGSVRESLPASNGRGRSRGDGKDSECVELITWQKDPSMLAEAFRTTLASILFSSQNGNSPRVIVVSSCSPMAGKTTVTCNLGIALAEINRRVLLIDGDLRKPRLHHIFGLENKRGLTDLLLDETPVDDYNIESVVTKTLIPNLHLLSCGSATSKIANLLFSTRLPELLKRLRRDFDTVLIDTPPMLNLSDARILGRLSDGVILVFFASMTSRDAALTAVECFRDDNTPVLGTILNHFNPKKTQGHYDNYYYYQNNDKPKANAKGA